MSSSQSRLAELASSISANTTKIDDYLTSNNLPKPSFEIDSPVDLKLPKDIWTAQDAVLGESTELKELLLGPRQTVVEYQYNYYVCLHALYRYKIPEALLVGEQATYAELAERRQLNEPDLRRLVRYAISNRIFKEVRKGVVAHTALSKLMAEDSSFRDRIGYNCEELWGAAVETVPAMIKWPDSQDQTKTGFSKYHNTDESITEFLENAQTETGDSWGAQTRYSVTCVAM